MSVVTPSVSGPMAGFVIGLSLLAMSCKSSSRTVIKEGGCRVEPKASCKGAHFAHENLQGVDMHAADLREADFADADLSGANLEGADLSRAMLYPTRLVGTRLRGANLRLADLDKAWADKADFRGADLREAIIGSVSFNDADLTGANLEGAQKTYYAAGTLRWQRIRLPSSGSARQERSLSRWNHRLCPERRSARLHGPPENRGISGEAPPRSQTQSPSDQFLTQASA